MQRDAFSTLTALDDIDGAPVAALALELMPVSASIVTAIREEGRIVDFSIVYSNRAASAGTDEATRTQHYGQPLFEVIPAFAESGLLARFIDVVERQESFAQDNVQLAGEYEGVKYDVVLEVAAVPLGGDHVLTVSHDRTSEHSTTARLTLAQEQLSRRAKAEAHLREVNNGIIDDLVHVQQALDTGDATEARRHASRGAQRAADIVLGIRDLIRTDS